MGVEKGLAQLAGRPLALYGLEAGERSAELIGIDCDSLIIANSDEYQDLGVKVVGDIRPGLGPLAGIETAITNATGDVALVIGCDMPFAWPPLLAKLVSALDSAEIAAPVGEYGPEPCMAAYSIGALGPIRSLLDNGKLEARGIFTATESVAEFSELDEHESLSLMSVDTPDDLASAEAILARISG